MAGYVGSLLAFFVAHCVLISSDTLFAVLNGYKFYHCCEVTWSTITLTLPFLPGIFSLPFFLWQVARQKKPCGRAAYDSAKYLAFPLLIIYRNAKHFLVLTRLDSEHDPRFQKIMFSAITLKLLKAIFESCSQAVLQTYILFKAGFNFLGGVLILLSVLSISFTCSKHLSLEVFLRHKIEMHSDVRRTALNCALYLAIILPRIFAMALIWTYYQQFAILFLLCILSTNFLLSYRTEQVSTKWKAGKSVVSLFDALASLYCPIFPQTMVKTSISTVAYLIVALVMMVPIMEYDVGGQSTKILANKYNVPVFSCIPLSRELKAVASANKSHTRSFACDEDWTATEAFNITGAVAASPSKQPTKKNKKKTPKTPPLPQQEVAYVPTAAAAQANLSADLRAHDTACAAARQAGWLFLHCVEPRCRRCLVDEGKHFGLFAYGVPVVIGFLLASLVAPVLMERYASSQKHFVPVPGQGGEKSEASGGNLGMTMSVIHS